MLPTRAGAGAVVGPPLRFTAGFADRAATPLVMPGRPASSRLPGGGRFTRRPTSCNQCPGFSVSDQIPSLEAALPSQTQRKTQAIRALRIVVAAQLFIHGAFRAATGGVAGFGEFLAASHVPAGLLVAWAITLLEIVGTVILASGRWVRPLAVCFASELAMGIAMVHAREGWFVVGGGRNGMEYSVTLIALLLAQAWAAPDRAPEA